MGQPDAGGATWRKSSYSGDGGGACLEVRFADGAVLVRDTKDREGGTLRFTTGEWEAFLAGVRNGEFELPG